MSPFSHNTLSPLTRFSPLLRILRCSSFPLSSACLATLTRRFFKVLRIQHLACAALISLR
jgi:hypothetical protein